MKRHVAHLFYWDQPWDTWAHIHHATCPQSFVDWAGRGDRMRRGTMKQVLRKRPLCPLCTRREEVAFWHRRLTEEMKRGTLGPSGPFPGS